MIPALFLDRDGVINENRANYVRSLEDLFIYPWALKALARIKDIPYKIIIVTNQSAIGRGLVLREEIDLINQRLLETIRASGGRVDGIYVCPHSPADGCDCRKPAAGLLHQAAADHDIDLKQSILIGDALSDLKAGQAAGVSQTVLLLTGRGEQQLQLEASQMLKPFAVYNDLFDAAAALFA